MAHENNNFDMSELQHVQDIQLIDTEEVDIAGPIKQWAKYMYLTTQASRPGSASSASSEDGDAVEPEVDQTDHELEDVRFDINLMKLKTNSGVPKFGNEGINPKTDNVVTQTLFETTFTNETNHKQAFSFKVERQTESVASVHLEKSILCSQGSESLLADLLKLKLPKEVETAGFGKYLHPTKARESFKKELTWSVDNLVNVPPKKKTTASLVITEKEYQNDFTMTFTLKGKVIVTVYDRKTDHIIRVLEGQIASIMDTYGPKITGLTNDNKKVQLETSGKCLFVFGVEQNVTLFTEKYDDNKTCKCCTLL